MNYIREINAFYDWLEVNSISDSCIVLWHALMHISNKAGWITEFSVAISTLEVKTGLKKDAINRARQRLEQVGRISVRHRGGQQSAIYRIIPFETHFVAQNTPQTTLIEAQNTPQNTCDVLNDTNRVTNRAQTASQSASQTASIIKLNETRPNSGGGEGAPVDHTAGWTEIDEHYLNQLNRTMSSPLDHEDMKEAMRLMKGRKELIIEIVDQKIKSYRPRFVGDKINSFSFFMGAIRQAAAYLDSKSQDVAPADQVIENAEEIKQLTESLIDQLPDFLKSEVLK